MSENTFVKIKPSNIRKTYGQRRIPVKLNLTDETHKLLGEIGAIRRVIGSKTIVAQRGGFGSAFIELAIELLLVLLMDKNEARERAVRYLTDTLYDLLDNDPEARAIVLSNARLILATLETHGVVERLSG